MKQKAFFLMLTVLLIFFSCKKDKNDDNGGNLPPETGFNETCSPSTFPGLDIVIDGETPDDIGTDTAVYNAYIACIADCAENNPGNPSCMMDCSGLLGILPAGGAFSLTLYITNTTADEITYIVEPGDWFEPGSNDYQQMMSPITITEVILPGQTVTLVIPVYCLAQSRSAPDEDSDYTMCEMISSSGCLADILAILNTKDMTSLNFNQSMQVQNIIWNCIEGGVINWDYLNNLPDL